MERKPGRHGVVRAAVEAALRGLPIDKGDRHRVPQLPQIHNPVVVAALGAGAVAAATALRMARPARRQGRDARFRTLLARAVARTPALRGGGSGAAHVDVGVHEAFGKPALVSFDVALGRAMLAQVGERSPLLADLLERAVQAAWENPELAPVAVRGRLLAGDRARELLNLVDIGFTDEIARPADLFERYGAPPSDPTWRP